MMQSAFRGFQKWMEKEQKERIPLLQNSCKNKKTDATIMPVDCHVPRFVRIRASMELST